MSARRAQQDAYRRGQGDLSPFLCEGVSYPTWVIATAFGMGIISDRDVRLALASPLVMRDNKLGGLLVVEKDWLRGIITETDMLNALIQVLIAEPGALAPERRT